jgi:hypothetical protein
VSDTDKISIFSIPKAFQGLTGTIQRNAIESWIELRPSCEIVLFGQEVGTKELTAQLGLKHAPDLQRNDRGTPLVSDLFQQAQERASNPVLCYVNADIILPKNFLQSVERVRRRFQRFLIVGCAVDLDVTKLLDFRSDWETDIHNLIGHKGRLRSPWGSDYFVFPKGLWPNIPPFAIGRTAWDNWLMYEALSHDAAVIDATSVTQAVHQNHDYGQYRTWAGKRTSDEAEKNRKLYVDSTGAGYWFGLKDVTHRLKRSRIRSTFWGRIRYSIWKICRTSPFFELLAPALKLQSKIKRRNSQREEKEE